MSNISPTNPSTNASGNITPSKGPAAASPAAATATTGAEASAYTTKATAAGNLSTASAKTAPPSATATTQPMTSNRPVLDEPKSFPTNMSGPALEAFIQVVFNNSAQATFKNIGTALDGLGKQVKAENEKRAAEDKKAQDAALKAQNQSFWSKLWGYVSKVATIIAAGAMTAVTGGAAFAFAAVLVVSAVAGLVKSIAQDAGAKWADNIPTSVGDLVGKVLIAAGVDKETAGWVSMGVDVTLAVAGLGVGLAGLRNAVKSVQNVAQTAAEKAAQTATNQTRLFVGNAINAGGSVVAGGSQVAASVQNMAVGETNAQAQTAQANSKEIQATLNALQTMFTQLTDETSQLQQNILNLFQTVSDILAKMRQTNTQIAQKIV